MKPNLRMFSVLFAITVLAFGLGLVPRAPAPSSMPTSLPSEVVSGCRLDRAEGAQSLAVSLAKNPKRYEAAATAAELAVVEYHRCTEVTAGTVRNHVFLRLTMALFLDTSIRQRMGHAPADTISARRTCLRTFEALSKEGALREPDRLVAVAMARIVRSSLAEKRQ